MSATEKQNSRNFSLYPLFRLAVCFAFGILVGKHFEIGWKMPLIACLIGGGLTAIFIKQKTAVVFISLSFVAAGAQPVGLTGIDASLVEA